MDRSVLDLPRFVDFFLSFVLLKRVVVFSNAVLHSNIALEMYKEKGIGGRNPNFSVISDLIYRTLIYYSLLGISYLSGMLPYVGGMAKFTLFSLLYSSYCFEFKWTVQGLSSTQCMELIEQRWLYFVGFGAPLTLLAYSHVSFFTSYALINVLIPVFCTTALYGKPCKQEYVPRLRIRRWSESWFINPLISYFSKKVSQRTRSKSNIKISKKE